MAEQMCPKCAKSGTPGKIKREYPLYGFDDCECIRERAKAHFLEKLNLRVGATPYSLPRFEALNPFSQHLYFVGMNTQASQELIYGSLRDRYEALDGKFTVVYTETWALSGTYAGDENSLPVEAVRAADLVVVELTNVTKSDKMNLIIKWLHQIRSSKGKITWFNGVGTDLLASYERPTLLFLESLKTVRIEDYLLNPPVKSSPPPKSKFAPKVDLAPAGTLAMVSTLPHKSLPVKEVTENLPDVCGQSKKRLGRPPGSKNNVKELNFPSPYEKE